MKRTVRSYLKPYWLTFDLALGQLLFISALELLKPWPLKIIIDNVLSDNPLPWGLAPGWSSESLLLLACVGLVVVYFLLGGLRLLNDYTTIRIGQSMVNDLRRDLYSHIQRLSLSFYRRQQIGDLMYRVTADTLGIQTLTMNGIFAILSASVLLTGMLLVMLWVDWYLTLLAMIVCPLLFCAIAFLNEKISLATDARQREAQFILWCSELYRIRVIRPLPRKTRDDAFSRPAGKPDCACIIYKILLCGCELNDRCWNCNRSVAGCSTCFIGGSFDRRNRCLYFLSRVSLHSAGWHLSLWGLVQGARSACAILRF
jgi:ATP-binding cassette subfamily B protein/subfamily B ATP-binding cassette protein MsbA